MPGMYFKNKVKIKVNGMKLVLEKLTWLPSFFEDEPHLLEEVLKKDITEVNEFGGEENLRKFHTKCNCKDGAFYWQEEKINNKDVEIFACETCKQWSMSVTY